MVVRGARSTCVCVLVCLLLFVTYSLPAIAQSGPPPSPWVAADIGAPQPQGSTAYDQGVFSVAGGGPDIRGSSDEFHFVYQPIAGDVEIVARIDSLIASDPWAKVGVMIRGDLTASAAHGFAAVSAGQGLAFVRRLQSGANT